MKILFVLTYYRPHWTGLTQYAARLAEGLVKKNHKVAVLCSQHDKELDLEEEVGGVKVFRLPYLFRILRTVIMPKFPFQLWKRIKENAVIVSYLPIQEVLLIAIFCKIQKKKLFLVHNGDLVLPSSCGFLCRLVEKIYYWSTFWSIKMAQAIIVQSNDYSENSKLLSGFREKRKVILPLFETPNVEDKSVEEFKKKNNISAKTLIGFSGRFVEEKGVDYLLEAIPKVKEKIKNTHFVFAGDYKINYEKFWDKIKILIEKNKNNITLLGLVKSQIEIFSFYKSLSVYVQPSVTDCFPSSQIEALLAGIPSVCTDIPGARWVVSETGMGELVKSKNPDALAGGIVKVIKDRERYCKNFDKVKKIFDYQKTLSDYEKLFKEN